MQNIGTTIPAPGKANGFPYAVQPSAGREMARGDENHDIIYSIRKTPRGKILLARTAVGVCSILIGSDDQALTDDLHARFPGRRLTWGASQLQDELDKVIRFIERPAEEFNVPLDMRHGTPFQRRVWDALLAIPCGTRITYTALARRIGEPKAVRAVASACAANAIALGIPCHRVVRSDGTISGYRWGAELKQALLDNEAAIQVTTTPNGPEHGSDGTRPVFQGANYPQRLQASK